MMEQGTMVELKVRKIGDALGVVLPEEVITHLHARDGTPLYLVATSEGGYRLVPADPAFEARMAKADDIIGRYSDTLRILAR